MSKTKTKNRNVEICTSTGNDEWETPQKKKNKIEIIDPFRNEPISPLLNKPPMVRMGGKRYLSQYLINKINKFDYSMYIEAFFGGGRVYFEKNSHFMEIVNDKESRVANFFYCAKNFPEELTRLQSLLVKDENTFKRLYDHYHDPHNTEYEDIKRARLLWEKYQDQESKVLLIHKAIDFYYYSNMGFRGSLTARTMTYFENDPRTENNRMRWRIFRPLEWLGNRMRRTMVLNQDFSRIIKLGLRYNHSRIWFFDPPYWKTEPYELPFRWEQYEKLNELLKQIPETDYFILTLNINKKLQKLFSWCNCEEKETHYTTGGAGQRKEALVNIFTPKWKPKMKKINLSKFMEGK